MSLRKMYFWTALILILFLAAAGAATREEQALAEAATQADVAHGATVSSVSHILDALTAEEYNETVQLLRDNGYADDETRFPLITLKEPPKETVLDWQPGDPIPRAAFVILKQGASTREAVVELSGDQVVSFKEVEGVQPSILFEEVLAVTGLVLDDPEFQAALQARGITDFSQVNCIPLTVGYYGLPEEEDRRLLKVPCFDLSGTTNSNGKPIGGLFAVVDLNSSEVLDVVDSGVRPIPPESAQYDEASIPDLRDPLKPVVYSQPLGSNITLDSNVVEWQNWQVHFRYDKRLGVILSLVSYQDGDVQRPVMYQGSLSEVFVPYQNPNEDWYWKTFMDAGEYGFGVFGSPLVPGQDVPETATLFDVVLSDDLGNPYAVPNVIALFERNTGAPAWRHFDFLTGSIESRLSVELVLRSISTVGNYDYIVDWIFTQDARMRVVVSATGIDLSDGVQTAEMSDPTAEEDTAYGALVAPHVVAMNHDHYFNFRLDLDVDGTENAFVQERLRRQVFPHNPRTSVWVLDERVVKDESDAQLVREPAQPAAWKVINPAHTNRLGNHTGYVLAPLNSAERSLLLPNDYPQQRAAFSRFNLWVTRYDPGEIYAAGVYVNQSQGGDGLPHYVADDESIENEDIVLWYTVGLHHTPHAEDWPVMSLEPMAFELHPADFFGQNPAINLRSQFQQP